MCRHICPIGNVTGQERNNARGRAISLSLVERKAAELADVIDNVYECALCGACTKECVTGWDPVAFTKEVRLEAALNGQTPPYIGRLLENIEKTGNPYGASEISQELAEEIAGLPQEAEVLLFLGQDARYMAPRAAICAIRLLKAAGVAFTVLAAEPDSGYALDALVGASQETKQAMEKAAGILAGFSTVVAFDPADAKVFLREYKQWNLPCAFEAKTFTSFVAQLITGGKLRPRKLDLKAAFQDPAHLARDLEETDQARTIVDACALRCEMLLYGKDTMWAGDLLMNTYLPEVMKKTAAARWKNAQAAGAEALITASPSEYAVLDAAKPAGMQLLSLEQLVLQALTGGAGDAR
jgi:Fe-S oxidoreductase